MVGPSDEKSTGGDLEELRMVGLALQAVVHHGVEAL